MLHVHLERARAGSKGHTSLSYIARVFLLLPSLFQHRK